MAKAGYGTVCEAMACGTPIIYPPRQGFSEFRAPRPLAPRLGRRRPGLRPRLLRLQAGPGPRPRLNLGTLTPPYPTDGAERVADHLAGLCQQQGGEALRPADRLTASANGHGMVMAEVRADDDQRGITVQSPSSTSATATGSARPTRKGTTENRASTTWRKGIWTSRAWSASWRAVHENGRSSHEHRIRIIDIDRPHEILAHRSTTAACSATLCPRFCKLHEGQRGFCFVRAREGDQVVLTTYGRSSGFCVDPIEKKPLNHFLPGTPVLSFGTAGCNLACKFCQNWDISKSREIDTLADAGDPRGDRRARRRRLGCRSVAFTYNDPVIFLEYAIDVAEACRERGIRTVAVTAGYVCAEPRARVLRGAWTRPTSTSRRSPSEFYRAGLRGHARRRCSRRCEYLEHETAVWFEITTLLIPGRERLGRRARRDDPVGRRELGPDVPLHFTAFHPDYRMLDRAAHAAAPRSPGARDRAAATACGTSTRATCTTPRPTAPAAIIAASS